MALAPATVAFRSIDATDVDHFVTLPRVLYVETRLAMDAPMDYSGFVFQDCELCLPRDYALHVAVPLRTFLNASVSRWQCVIKERGACGAASGSRCGAGPALLDAGVGGGDVVVNPKDLYEAVVDAPCTFCHMRQARAFFDRSFPVGSAFTLAASAQSTAQLYAVYLDKDTGEPLEPFVDCLPCCCACPPSCSPAPLRMYYAADLAKLSLQSPQLSVLSPWPTDVDAETQQPVIVDTVVSPASHARQPSSSPPCGCSASGPAAAPTLSFTQDPRRALFMYYAVYTAYGTQPVLYGAYRSHALMPARDTACCVCACGGSAEPAAPAGGVPAADQFDRFRVAPGLDASACFRPGLFYAVDRGECPAIYHPSSVISYVDLLTTDGSGAPAPHLFRMPFSFDRYNTFSYTYMAASPLLTVSGETLLAQQYQVTGLPPLGHRISQAIFMYITGQEPDTATYERQLAVFPYLREEMNILVRNICGVLAQHVRDSSRTRQAILDQVGRLATDISGGSIPAAVASIAGDAPVRVADVCDLVFAATRMAGAGGGMRCAGGGGSAGVSLLCHASIEVAIRSQSQATDATDPIERFVIDRLPFVFRLLA